MIMRGKCMAGRDFSCTAIRFNEAAHDHARKGQSKQPQYRETYSFNEAAHDHARKAELSVDRGVNGGPLQ